MSKCKSSELVRGAGMATSVWQKFAEAIERNHGLPEDLHLLAQSGGDYIIDAAAKQLAMAGAMQRNADVIPVNYDLPHMEQVAAGKFDWISDYDNKLIWKNPTKHLVSVPSGGIEQRITQLHLDREVKTEEVFIEMDKRNLRPTISNETLAFAAAHPDVQRNYALIGLGSVWVATCGDRGVLDLYRDSSGRYLRLSWYDRVWQPGRRFRFLAVPKT